MLPNLLLMLLANAPHNYLLFCFVTAIYSMVHPVCLFLSCLFFSDFSVVSAGSIKGRRSSYLLAITTERSKSCDEGLNTFREEGRVFS